MLFLALCCFALAVPSACSGSTGTATSGVLKTSMKGWELYSWQEDGDWLFSLLEGTNREKSSAEIQASDATLEGIDALEATLESIAPGQYVTWWSPGWVEEALAFPPDDTVEEVQRICEDQGLQLTIAK